MDNFNLKNYLADNKLLKEEKENLDEDILTILGYISFQRIFGGVLGKIFGPITKRIDKAAERLLNAFKKYKDLTAADNIWIDYIKSKKLEGIKIELQQDLLKSTEAGGKRYKYKDKKLLTWYRDAVSLLDLIDDLYEQTFILIDEFSEMNGEIDKRKEKGENIPKEEIKVFKDKEKELESYRKELHKRLSYEADLRFIANVIKKEIDRRDLKVENNSLLFQGS